MVKIQKKIIAIIILGALSFASHSFLKNNSVQNIEKDLNIEEETISLYLYIQDKEEAETRDCGITKKVEYKIPKTLSLVDNSLEILFGDELSWFGFYESVKIVDGIAKISVSLKNEGRLSSCQISHLISVLNDTLTQYPNIKGIEIYSNGVKIEF